MIRFSFDSPADAGHAYGHFSIEGDNTRGYVLLGWSPHVKTKARHYQAWFETLGEALSHCAATFHIPKDSWSAPTATPPPVFFKREDRGRRKGEASVLNSENVRERERRDSERLRLDQPE